MADAKRPDDTFIVFSVAGTVYAVPSGDVQHMEMVEEVTRVPNALPFIDGVVFSRGQVVPAMNLRMRFGFERAPYDLRTRLLVVNAAGRSVGLIVDEAREFLRLPEEAIHAPQDTMAGVAIRYIRGIASVAGRLVVVLDIHAMLTSAEPLVTA